ncbi:MAG: 3-isopropylmalate dehydratase small subunit [Acetobacteraceae bacterium]
MTPFKTQTGRAAVLDRGNVDTDQIIPARFLRHPREDGYNNFLFYDLRAHDPAFPLGVSDNPPILLAGPNFGCGSSREGAVYALADSGVRCVIAPGFGDIFAANAGRNGLLTVALPEADWQRLRQAVDDGAEVTVDLMRQELRAANLVLSFDIDPFRWELLLRGVDDIDLTLENAEDIENFEANVPSLRPWAIPS